MVTWRKAITEMMDSDDSWDNVEKAIIEGDDSAFDEEFYDGYGGENGKPFTVWTKDYIYFPVCYDGAEWCGRISRHPCDTPTDHFGGG